MAIEPEDLFSRNQRGGVTNDKPFGSARQVRSIKQASRRVRTITQSTSAAKTGGGGSREVVFKVVHHLKSPRGVIAVARYISQNRDSEDRAANREVSPDLDMKMEQEGNIPFHDEQGSRLNVSEALDRIDNWKLVADRHNLTPAAREASPDEFRAMKANERLQKRQATHIILSLPPRKAGGTDPQTLHRIAADTMEEAFGSHGHSYLFAIHEDKARPHVHAIIRNVADFDPATGRRHKLHLSKDRTQEIRDIFARTAQREGLAVESTRRMDRPELRRNILSGTTQLKLDAKIRAGIAASNFHTDLERRAPDWHREFARDALNGALAETRGQLPERPASRPTLMNRIFGRQVENPAKSSVDNPLTDHFNASYPKPFRAAQSFRALASDDFRLAKWALKNRPAVFGTPFKDVKGLDANSATIRKHLGELPEAPRSPADPRRRAANDQAVKAATDTLNTVRATKKNQATRTYIAKALSGVATTYSHAGDADQNLLARAHLAAVSAEQGKIPNFEQQPLDGDPTAIETTLTRRQKLRQAIDRRAQREKGRESLEQSQAPERNTDVSKTADKPVENQDPMRRQKMRAAFERQTKERQGPGREMGPKTPGR